MVTERSTKSQRELLQFVDQFIQEHGYGPSYREIMKSLGYKSVSTVAIHINGLITKGYLTKRDNSARSLEVVSSDYVPGKSAGVQQAALPAGATAAREKWLVGAVESRFAEYKARPSQQLMDELYVLIGALKVLGFDAAYEAMRTHLAKIVSR